eukprot:CAMPEP_0202027436 /NCGR_PEP_ID=MMETSP0905-20130828/61465_1 /ASSEMBLY_ACC=CAM_ASM_000554 /TAXON_ID=420261 /ORGANISM="Thalassiosira antarctica, Strain CCMP982" /LENGTH=399 /DNA_ID=CAMNT_0048590947 /DNA_START=52 /DNA_END=1251 /DNA_ORIENTATION=-
MTTINKSIVTETTYSCSDGVKLAARHWTNFDTKSNHDPSSRHTRKMLCLHGWLDNAASFNRLAPLLLGSSSIPTEIVALDFPGHGHSAHKSVDGPPQLLAEYAYYVSELVEALQWGRGNNGGSGVGNSRTVVGNINSNTNNDGNRESRTKNQSSNSIDNIRDTDSDKIVLIGHSMGSAVSLILCAAFPEWFSALVLLDGGMVARNANDASRHVRAACQRRLKSNRTLFPNGSNNGSGANGETIPLRVKIYKNVDTAIEARLSTTTRMPGDQFLSFEAAKDMVIRATAPANVASTSSPPADSEAVVFRHDPRLQWPSLQYYTREQVEAFFRDVNTSNIPVCFLWAADGWPVDAWSENVVKDVLKPGYSKRLSGSHHFHADPDSVDAVANEIVMFMEEQKL